MKHFIMTVAIAIAGFSCIMTTTAQAQEKTEETVITTDSTGNTTTTKIVRVSKTEDITPRHNVIVVNPLKFFFFYNLSYYRMVSPQIAIGGGLQMPTLDGISGLGANGEMRFYPSGKALRGFYLAPNISYNNLSSEGESVSIFSVGGLFGWQWFPGDDFAIGLGIGIDQYFISSDDNNDAVIFDDYEGTLPALRFDIGYGW